MRLFFYRHLTAGEKSGDIQVKILGDTEVEGNERFFLDISTVSGGIFAKDQPTQSVEIQILEDEGAIAIPQIGQTSIQEGDDVTGESTLNISLQRTGNLDREETVEIEIIPMGDNPIDAQDLVNGLAPQQVTFQAGEDAQVLSLAIATDSLTEPEESFAVQLKSTTGSSQLSDQSIVYQIQDREPSTTPPPPPTSEDELKRGTEGNDTLRGRQGNDTLFGLDGDDLLLGGQGNDLLFGLAGDDTLKGGKGEDTLHAGLKQDNSRRNQSQSQLWGGAGDDVLYGDAGNNDLRGNKGDDELLGGQGRDTLRGGRGSDRLVGGQQNDKLLGGSGDDVLEGGKGKDVLRGGLGADLFTLQTTMGTDRFADFSAEDRILLEDGLRFQQLDIRQTLGTTQISLKGSSEVLAILPGAIALSRQSFVTTDLTP